MKAAASQVPSLPSNFRLPLRTGLFFLLYFCYVWWWIDPALEFQAYSPIFFTGGTFLSEFTGYPGGLLEYIAAFLGQFFLFPWLGAAITTGLAGLLYLAFKQALIKTGTTRPQMLPFVPPVLLLMAQQQYSMPWLTTVLGLLLALIFTVVYTQCAPANFGLSCLVFWLLAIPLYYLAAGHGLVYVGLAGLFELLMRRRFRLGLAHLAGLLLIPYVARSFVFVMSWRDACAWLLPIPWRHQPMNYILALYLIPILILGIFAAGRINFPQGVRRSRPLAWAGNPLLWLGIAVVALWWTSKAEAKRLLRIEYYTQRKQWSELLRVAADVQGYHPATVADVDQALAHTGQLLASMFAYPQRHGSDFWFHFHDQMDPRKCLKSSDLLFELGQVNRAERMACESLENNGRHPATLKRLFYIRVLKDDPQSARLFLNLLTRTLWHRNWAGRYLRMLAMDPQLADDPELQPVRQVMLRQDYVGDAPTEPILQQALRRNRHNQMAFEYLMAYYLINSEIDKVVQNLDRLDDFSYPEIPRHVEEALLIYQKLNPTNTVDLHGHKLNANTLARYQRFHEALRPYADNLAVAPAEIAREFGDTYWFYYLYEYSGCLFTSIANRVKK